MMDKNFLRSWAQVFKKDGFAICYCSGKSGPSRIEGLEEIFRHLRDHHQADEEQLVEAFTIPGTTGEVVRALARSVFGSVKVRPLYVKAPPVGTCRPTTSELADLLPQYEDAIVEAELAQVRSQRAADKRAQLSARCTELGLTQELLDRVSVRVGKRLKEAK